MYSIYLFSINSQNKISVKVNPTHTLNSKQTIFNCNVIISMYPSYHILTQSKFDFLF